MYVPRQEKQTSGCYLHEFSHTYSDMDGKNSFTQLDTKEKFENYKTRRFFRMQVIENRFQLHRTNMPSYSVLITT